MFTTFCYLVQHVTWNIKYKHQTACKNCGFFSSFAWAVSALITKKISSYFTNLIPNRAKTGPDNRPGNAAKTRPICPSMVIFYISNKKCPHQPASRLWINELASDWSWIMQEAEIFKADFREQIMRSLVGFIHVWFLWSLVKGDYVKNLLQSLHIFPTPDLSSPISKIRFR